MTIQLTSAPADGAINEAATYVRAGQLEAALQALMARVRSAPGAADERLFLFQLLAVMGQWQRAGDQLEVACQLDAGNALMRAACQRLLQGEAQRDAVFAGRCLPHVLGAPEPWIAPLLRALQFEQSGQAAAAAPLRAMALESAPAVGGLIDGQRFAWLCDADARFGPCLEVIAQGGYGWVPLTQVEQIRFDAPQDLRDLVWLPAELVWRDGTEAVVFVPARYPGTTVMGDDLRLSRRTEWNDQEHGLGQRMLATDSGDHALLETRVVVFDPPN